jgi:hypothetical protein
MAIPLLQYKMIEMVGKKIVLPLFMDNITNISAIIMSLKSSSGEKSVELKDELFLMDLEHKVIAIGAQLKEISDEDYTKNSIHINLCGVYDVLENIKAELDKINTEYEYIKMSWYHYTIGWMWFSSSINVKRLQNWVKLLNDRYNMLIQTLMIK